MPAYPPLSTQVIGKAESALGALLAPVLAEASLTFPQWLVLVIATADGDSGADRGQLVTTIAEARKIDPGEVTTAVDTLEAAALVAADGARVKLTGAGRASYRQVRSRLDEITARVFDFPAEDLAAAGRILGIVTERANAVLAAS